MPTAARRGAKLPIILIIVALGMLVWWFTLSARSVSFSLQPKDAQFDINGGFVLEFGERVLMLPGSYEVEVSHPEYLSVTRPITVDEGDQQTVSIVLQRKPDVLRIAAEPADMLIRVDGVAQPTGRLELSLQAGQRLLQFEHPRYLKESHTITVEGGGNLLERTVDLRPAWADISMDSYPSGARIYSGDQLLGSTPATLYILRGEHKLRLSVAGYKDKLIDLNVVAQQAQDLGVLELEAADALVALESQPSGAGVLIDGEFAGQTPLQLNLSSSTDYDIELFKDGYQKIVRKVRYQAGDRKRLNLVLAALLGEVELQLPDGADRVTINGRDYPPKSGRLQLPAGQQNIKVTRAGYADFHASVEPRPGFSQRVIADLKSKDEVKRALRPARRLSGLGQDMVLVTPADFKMGASRREAGRRANEVQRDVKMQRAFYMSAKEVTNAQYRLFDPKHSSGRVNDKSLNGNPQPVVQVSWIQAAEFCNWLSARDGLTAVYTIEAGELKMADLNADGYRLPTEAEWAYAARNAHGSMLKYPWGSTLPALKGAGNFADDSAAYIVGRTLPNYADGYAASAPVGSFTPNALQFYDMGGNVSEWMHDYYQPGKPKQEQRDPSGANTGNYRVVRGSSWRHGSQVELRLSYRDYAARARDDLGFRIARYAEKKP